MVQHFAEHAASNLAAVREKKPLIHSITNLVVMNFTANVLLAMGASPVMAHASSEVEEMVAAADGLVLNIGTLSEAWIESMLKAGKRALQQGIPIVLDPVGAGASRLRTKTAKKIISAAPMRVIRGNASEIISLHQAGSQTRGVESVHSVDEAAPAAKNLAQALKTTLAITGPEDLLTDGTRVIRVCNGHPLMGFVSGTGCAATAIIAAFLAVDDDPLRAAAGALAFLGAAGEVAAENASAPGSFMIQMIDALYAMTPEALKQKCRIYGD